MSHSFQASARSGSAPAEPIVTLDGASLLPWLARRLFDAHGALPRRVDRAAAIAVGRVVRQRVHVHGEQSFFVADVEVDRWLRGGAECRSVMVVSGPRHGATRPRATLVAGGAGVILLDETPPDVAAVLPCAMAPEGDGMPCLIDDPDERLASAIAGRPRLDVASSASFQLSLDRLVRAGDRGPIEAALAGASELVTMALRAALLRIGRHPGAPPSIVDPAALADVTLRVLGLLLVEEEGATPRLYGPAPDRPIGLLAFGDAT